MVQQHATLALSKSAQRRLRRKENASSFCDESEVNAVAVEPSRVTSPPAASANIKTKPIPAMLDLSANILEGSIAGLHIDSAMSQSPRSIAVIGSKFDPTREPPGLSPVGSGAAMFPPPAPSSSTASLAPPVAPAPAPAPAPVISPHSAASSPGTLLPTTKQPAGPAKAAATAPVVTVPANRAGYFASKSGFSVRL